jgi:hypothetical protein
METGRGEGKAGSRGGRRDALGVVGVSGSSACRVCEGTSLTTRVDIAGIVCVREGQVRSKCRLSVRVVDVAKGRLPALQFAVLEISSALGVRVKDRSLNEALLRVRK